MTLSRPKQGSYDPNYNPRPKTVCIGCSLITHEVDVFEQDGHVVEVPVEEAICYITVPREIVYLPCGGASYDIIADFLEQEGYPRRIWKIMSVWTVKPNTSNEEMPF